MAFFLLFCSYLYYGQPKIKKEAKKLFFRLSRRARTRARNAKKTPSHLFIPFPLHHTAQSMFPVSEKTGNMDQP